jgi:hypothetical protein
MLIIAVAEVNIEGIYPSCEATASPQVITVYQ